MASMTMSTLSGRELRYTLTLTLLDADRPLGVADLAVALAQQGRTTPGRTGKDISDALRWEVRRGRAVRLGRNRYVAGEIPRSTIHWMRTTVAGTRPRRAVAPTWR